MEIVRAWEEQGVKIPAPYSRTIKMLFAPDKGDVAEISFSFALIDPLGKTDYHTMGACYEVLKLLREQSNREPK